MKESQQPSFLATECEAIKQSVEFVATSRLRKGRSQDQVEGLIRKADLLLDSKLSEVVPQAESGTTIACRPGCDHCCHRVVLSTVLEALAASIFVERSLSPDRQIRFNQRLEAHFAVVGSRMGHDLELVRIPCPMLEDGLCSIYEVRPLACRARFSSDAAACQSARNDSQIPFPSLESGTRLGASAETGLSAGMAANGLWSQKVDFARTVGLALSDPSGCARYLFGLPMYETATPVEDEVAPAPVQGRGTVTYRSNEEPTGFANEAVLEHSRFLLKTKGNPEDAFRKRPDDGPLQQMFRVQTPIFYSHEDEIDHWHKQMVAAFDEFTAGRFDLREKFDAILAYNPLAISYQQKDDKVFLSKVGDYLSNEVAARVFPDLCEPLPKRKRQGRLRVGFVSIRLGLTSGSYWSLGWLKHRSSEVETFAFYLGPTLIPGSEDFQQCADHFFHLPGAVGPAARLIKEQNLDVLIYTDATSDGRSLQFATLRLAPVQCASWGDPETLGFPNIDYFLSSEDMEPEDGGDHYREKLVRLPGTGISYVHPERYGLGWRKTHFGLDDGPLYVCTQIPSKLLPQWDFIFRDICEKSGRPIVFFAYPGTAARMAEGRLKQAGVDARFLPCLNNMQFFDLLRLADATLDSIGWSGGITTLLALQQRRPVVTLPGKFRRGRQSLAFLKAANVSGLIASNPAEYVDLVINADRRHAASENMQPESLFDDTNNVRALEAFLLRLDDMDFV